jgi:two-component system cell cycle response regulator
MQNKLEVQENHPVLIVEDNAVSRKILEISLARQGYSFVSVENGRKALEILKKDFFSIVITDLIMPEMNGIQLCQAIRQCKFPSYVFIIMLTTLNSKKDIVIGLEAGADDYLTKPFNHAELLARLKTGERILQLEKSLRSSNEEILKLSFQDPLTKIYNRGFINIKLPEEMIRSKRYGRPLSIIMADIDFFKKVNDKYGHLAGDQVLIHVTKLLKKNIRNKVDWLARWGGEEFLIVLPETPVEGAQVVAERMRQTIAHKTILVDPYKLEISSSFGVACCNFSTYENPQHDILLANADKMLYQAKNKGRNRVETYTMSNEKDDGSH